MKIKELGLALFIIFSLIVLIKPPPPWLLSFMLIISITLSIIIMLNALYAKEPLEMSFFPTILLTITLYKLVLNFSTTRAILGGGDAGAVVDTFAEFVAGGDMIVGSIVFIILVLVNFIVISKGTERVAEVTARFTLDAMPGKQMAIDADLNTGLIDEAEAKARRKKIADESAFFGAMDGASKFFKNDAIVGILITAINFIGGVALGVTGIANNGVPLEFGDAAAKFGMLTIGDGLVGQIPSLMISFATGLLVTKATGDEGIGTTIVKQLFGTPIVMYISGGFLIFLGLFANLPPMILLPLGLALIVFGYVQSKKKEEVAVQTELTAEEDEAEVMRRPESVTPLISIDPILLQIGYGLIPYVDEPQGGDMLDRVALIRREIALEYGVVVPTIRLRDDIKLNPNEYRICIKGEEVAKGDILFDHYLAFNPGYVEEEIDGIETEEPYYHIPALWIAENQRERAEALGYQVTDPPAIMSTHLTGIITEHLHELLTRQDVQTLINNVKEKNSVLVEELIPRLMNIGNIQKVLANLLREHIPIKDLVTILETLADYAPLMHDPDLLTERVREALKRTISRRYFTSDLNTVITLDPNLEQKLVDSMRQNEQGSYLALDPLLSQKIFENLRREMGKLTSMGLQPIILTSPIVRTYFKKLVEPFTPDLVVLSYNELDQHSAEIQSIGVVSI